MAEDFESEETEQGNTEINSQSAGDMLREAREQKNLALEDIAKTTRIPQRHLEAIETGDYGTLPGRTYVIGFAKSYARTVGLSEVTIGAMLREEMDDQGHSAYESEISDYAPANPSNVAPKYLAWVAGGIAVLLLAGFLIWRSTVLGPYDPLEEGSETELADNDADDGPLGSAVKPAAPAASPTGTVVLTATETVWLRIYDEEGERLFEKEMAVGEQYTVPADAKNPQILTGRPNALTVTIDGAVVPALGPADQTIKDVGVSAAALLARGAPGGAAATPNPTPGAGAAQGQNNAQ